jgi:hypothetical protein
MFTNFPNCFNSFYKKCSDSFKFPSVVTRREGDKKIASVYLKEFGDLNSLELPWRRRIE